MLDAGKYSKFDLLTIVSLVLGNAIDQELKLIASAYLVMLLCSVLGSVLSLQRKDVEIEFLIPLKEEVRRLSRQLSASMIRALRAKTGGMKFFYSALSMHAMFCITFKPLISMAGFFLRNVFIAVILSTFIAQIVSYMTRSEQIEWMLGPIAFILGYVGHEIETNIRWFISTMKEVFRSRVGVDGRSGRQEGYGNDHWQHSAYRDTPQAAPTVPVPNALPEDQEEDWDNLGQTGNTPRRRDIKKPE